MRFCYVDPILGDSHYESQILRHRGDDSGDMPTGIELSASPWGTGVVLYAGHAVGDSTPPMIVMQSKGLPH